MFTLLTAHHNHNDSRWRRLCWLFRAWSSDYELHLGSDHDDGSKNQDFAVRRVFYNFHSQSCPLHTKQFRASSTGHDESVSCYQDILKSQDSKNPEIHQHRKQQAKAKMTPMLKFLWNQLC